MYVFIRVHTACTYSVYMALYSASAAVRRRLIESTRVARCRRNHQINASATRRDMERQREGDRAWCVRGRQLAAAREH